MTQHQHHVVSHQPDRTCHPYTRVCEARGSAKSCVMRALALQAKDRGWLASTYAKNLMNLNIRAIRRILRILKILITLLFVPRELVSMQSCPRASFSAQLIQACPQEWCQRRIIPKLFGLILVSQSQWITLKLFLATSWIVHHSDTHDSDDRWIPWMQSHAYLLIMTKIIHHGIKILHASGWWA